MKTGIKNPFIASVLIAALSLLLAGRVSGQTFTVLHSFTFSDGAYPQAGLVLSSNTLYGTAILGGSPDFGTVFKVNTDGTGFTTLHNFNGGGGQTPNGDLILSGNTLYGTTPAGGSLGLGTVFAVNTDGTGFTNLHGFDGDGALPYAGLLLSGNTLYGTAESGFKYGTVFAVSSNGTGFTTLHIFTGGSNGGNPVAAVLLSGNTLYGTAEGGNSSNGTVFKVNTDGTGFTNLYSFTARSTNSACCGGTNSDGAGPHAGLLLSGNMLYGTARFGGSSARGTVFKVNTDGTGFTTLHSFTAVSTNSSGTSTNSDGTYPSAGLILTGNTLYGTAEFGGSGGSGTVFKLNTDGTGFTNLYSFTARSTNSTGVYTNSDGADPLGGLILSGNTLYGTAYLGGSSGNGTVFSLSLGSTPPTVSCSTPLILECENGSAVGTIQAEAQDTNGNPIQVVWTLDGIPSQTNNIASGGTITASNVTFTANLGLGEHVVVVSASNGHTDPLTCSTAVTVHDTTPPQIKSIVAIPNVLWPPDHRMTPVHLRVEAVDNCDPSPVVKITKVTCNEPQNPLGADWEIAGATSISLRAERLGRGAGRIYTIVVQCEDTSGNVSTASVDVTVPHN